MGQAIKFNPSKPPNPDTAVPDKSPAVDVTLDSVPAPGTTLTFQLEVTDDLGQVSQPTTATVTIQGPPSALINPPTQSFPVTGKPFFSLAAVSITGAPANNFAKYTWTLKSVQQP